MLYFNGACKITGVACDFSVVNCMLLIILSNIMSYNNGLWTCDKYAGGWEIFLYSMQVFRKSTCIATAIFNLLV